MFSPIILCIYFMTTPEVCSTYRQVVSNKPDINLAYARKLSRGIVASAKKHNVRHNIYTAILMQESCYKNNAVNKKSKDYGIAQINIKTIVAFKFDKRKLLTDLNYSIDAGAEVLGDFKKRHFKKEGYNYWTRYNTSNLNKRLVYKQKVQKYF